MTIDGSVRIASQPARRRASRAPRRRAQDAREVLRTNFESSMTRHAPFGQIRRVPAYSARSTTSCDSPSPV